MRIAHTTFRRQSPPIPSFLASAVTSQTACARVYRALGEMSLTPPNTATATALVAAHGVVDSALADVRTRQADSSLGGSTAPHG